MKIINKTKKFNLKSKTFFFLSIIILLILLYNVDRNRAIETLQKIDVNLIFTSFIIYLFIIIFKTLRFNILLKDVGISFHRLLVIVSYHNFYNIILPARTGELTLIYFLKRLGSIKNTKGFYLLIVARILDVVIVSIFFVISVFFYYGIKQSAALFIIGLLLALSSILILLNLRWTLYACKKIFIYLTQILSLSKKKIIIKVNNKIDEFIYGFKRLDFKKSIQLALTSVLVWLGLYSFWYVIIFSFNINITYIETIIGSTGAIFTNVLPVNFFGSFGTLEAGWVGGFVAVGMGLQDAIISGFGSHLITLLISGFFALIFALYNSCL